MRNSNKHSIETQTFEGRKHGQHMQNSVINNNTERHRTANNNTHEITNRVKQIAENHHNGENNNDININKIDHIETHSSNESTKCGTLNSETNVNKRDSFSVKLMEQTISYASKTLMSKETRGPSGTKSLTRVLVKAYI